tara:strand:+ start:49 stop:549 length:501 start_codon:yes stop_codon:yes gene_type:complete
MSSSKKYLQTKKMLGNWQSKRLILDSFNKSKALYFGEMIISLGSEVKLETEQGLKHQSIPLNLREEGTLTIQGKTYQFRQKYLLHLSKDRCDVCFNNKSLFFSINRLAHTQEIDHFCHLDRYFGQINFVNEFSFFLRFNVKGPKKKYYLKVLYTRLKGCNSLFEDK